MTNHKEQNWDVKYLPNFCICKVISERMYDSQDPTGHVKRTAIADIQLLMPVEYIVSTLPDITVFEQACKDINYPSTMPDLKSQNNDQSDLQI